MFEPVVRDEAGAVVDPRDLPAPRAISAFCASQLDRYSSVLSANVEALEEENQLELGAHLSSCVATLEWLKCRVASSLAVKDTSDPVVARAKATGRGEPITRLLSGDGTPEVSEFLTTEIALAFGCSEREATAYLAVGLDLRFRLRCTNAEFGGGRITYQHAKVISEETRHLQFDTAVALDESLADAAASRTPARLRVLARRKAAAADPAALAKRHREAVAARSTGMFSIGDGMGAFSLTGPLETLAVIDDSVDAWARRLRSVTPAVPLAAHRADAAARLLLGQHPLTGQSLLAREAASRHGDSPAADQCGGTSAASQRGDTTADAPEEVTGEAAPQCTGWLPARTELRITMSADTLLGLDDATCDLQGHGPITASQARRLALRSACSTLRRVFTDPADDSVLFLDPRRYRFSRAQLETIAALHPHSTFPGATTRVSRCDIDHVDEYRTASTGSPGSTRPPAATRPPRSTGPPGSTGPLSLPGLLRSTVPAAQTDGLDPPGQTVISNAQPLSRRHHRLKTHGGWTVTRGPDDAHTYHWTSPRGRTYTTCDTDGA